MALMALIGFVGCDKIETDEYIVYDGAAVDWKTSTATVTPVQRVYVEKYTGPRCSNCPTADETLDGINNENVVIVSINHPNGQGTPYPNQPDMRTDGGTLWDKYFGINAIPAAFINRDRSTQYQGDMSNIADGINQALAENPIIALEVLSYFDKSKINVTTNLQFVKKYTDPVNFTAVLVEDSLVYRQLLPNNTIDDNYAHNHMLRKVITSYWGAEVTCTGFEGESLLGTLTFPIPDNVNLKHCHVVVFVSDQATRKVLNCASSEIMSETADKE